MNIGVVGLGYMGVTHLNGWKKVKGSQVTAVLSSDAKKLAGDFSSVGGNLSISSEGTDISSLKKYSEFEAILSDPEIDALDLCVPTDLHLPLATAGLEAGKHVLLEKPMALNGEECDSILKVAENTGKVLMVAQVVRYWPDYHEAKILIDSKKIGNLELAIFRRRSGTPNLGGWFNDIDRSGGRAFDLLIHDFDYCIHLFGTPQKVCTLGKYDPTVGIDWLETELSYPAGPKVIISGGWNPVDFPFAMEFTLMGSKGTLDYHSALRRLTFCQTGKKPKEYSFSEDDGFRAELQAFSDACRKGRPPAMCLPEQSAEAVKVILAALESRQQGGQPVSYSS